MPSLTSLLLREQSSPVRDECVRVSKCSLSAGRRAGGFGSRSHWGENGPCGVDGAGRQGPGWPQSWGAVVLLTRDRRRVSRVWNRSFVPVATCPGGWEQSSGVWGKAWGGAVFQTARPSFSNSCCFSDVSSPQRASPKHSGRLSRQRAWADTLGAPVTTGGA